MINAYVYVFLILVVLFCLREAFAAVRLRAALRDFIRIMNHSYAIKGIPVEKEEGLSTVTWDWLKAQGYLDNYLKLTKGEVYEV